MGKIRNWLKRYIPEDPLRMVANVRQQNRIANILEDIEGVGCRIDKPQNLEGMGWKIVVGDGTDMENPDGSTTGAYQFQVVRESDTEVKVRGGWWTYYNGEIRKQADLAEAGSDLNDLTNAIAVGSTGVIYIELVVSTTPSLTAKFATSAAWALLADTADTVRKLLAEVTVEASVITAIRHDWVGGDEMTSIEVIDDHSIDRNDDGELQLHHYDSASASTPSASSLFPFSGGGTVELRYARLDAITINLDDESLNFNSSGEAQLNDWATVSGTTVNPYTGESLVPFKRYAGGSYIDDLDYISIDEFTSTIADGIAHTDIDFTDAGSGWAPIGVGKSGGNTDHDDSYWHEYGASFVDAKDYHTTGEVHADKLQANNTTAAGSGTGALLVPGGGAYVGDGVYADKGAAVSAGRFDDDTNVAILADGAAMLTGIGDIQTTIGDIKIVFTGDYYHAGSKGVTVTGRASGGLDIGSTHEIQFQNLLPTDKILVRR